MLKKPEYCCFTIPLQASARIRHCPRWLISEKDRLDAAETRSTIRAINIPEVTVNKQEFLPTIRKLDTRLAARIRFLLCADEKFLELIKVKVYQFIPQTP
ncbi:MAG TPA: hypothetical protein VLJ21_04670 [Candidatus Binatia bacterium]|nr:hypothetical protein [Candidatus Binatia bacterium]